MEPTPFAIAFTCSRHSGEINDRGDQCWPAKGTAGGAEAMDQFYSPLIATKKRSDDCDDKRPGSRHRQYRQEPVNRKLQASSASPSRR